MERTRTAAMSTEAGTQACRVLIDCKAQLEGVLANLAHLENSEPIRLQLLAVYQELQTMHDSQIVLAAQRASAEVGAGAAQA